MTGDQLVTFLYQVAAGVAALGIGVAAGLGRVEGEVRTLRELWRALRGLTPLVMSDRWRLWHEANDWRGPSERGL